MIYMHIPKQLNISFDETSSVRGDGYVHVSRLLSTTVEKSALINRANISGEYRKVTTSPPFLSILISRDDSTSAVTILGSPGTELRTSEHGSGHYEEDEKSSLRLENKSITLQRDLFAKHKKTTFSLPGKRSIDYDSLWSDLSSGKNRVLNDVVSENYLYTDTLSKNSSYVLDMNQTVYRSDAEFSDGLARIAYRKHLPGSAKTVVDISEDYHGSFRSTSAVTILGSPGTELRTSEHGSGHYEEDEKSSLRLENKSITLQRDLFAKHRKTTFSLPGKRSIDYDSLWSDLSSGKNRVLNDVVSENYLYTDMLSKNSSYVLDMNQTVYRSDAEFSDGLARIAYRKHLPDSAKTIVDISEDYHGSFKVMEFVDSYGDSVKYAKSAQGKGSVASDKRPSKVQRSFEHGSGYYNSEETMQLDSVVKDSKMLYAPVNQTAGSQKINYSTLWEEGMWTKDPGKGLVISEATRSASYINKEAEMEKSSLSILGEFNGTMNLQLVKGLRPKKEEIRLDQTLVGSFRMDTALSVFTSPRHLYPHLNISKKAIMQDEEDGSLPDQCNQRRQ